MSAVFPPLDDGFTPVPDREIAQLRVPPHSIEAESSVLGGLLLAFTPCVLPMLPILAGIIARQHTSSSMRGFLLALCYVLGVATTYALTGALVGALGAQANLPLWFQHPLVTGTFAAFFLALALSLFGLFELRLPHALHHRLDTLSNLLEDPRIGLLFMIPGVDETLRVNGTARLRDEPLYTDFFTAERQRPKIVIEVRVAEAYLHCSKAFMRSRLWQADAQVDRSVLPSMNQMIHDQIGLATEPETHAAMLQRYRAQLAQEQQLGDA